jgi:hypothetical protein
MISMKTPGQEGRELISNIDVDEFIEFLYTKLRHRRIRREATSDERLKHLNSILQTKPPQRLLRHTEDL